MQNGDKALITKDTGYKGAIWGHAGEVVTIISISGNAVIVENAKGFRFPCSLRTELKPWTAELERSLRHTNLQKSEPKKSRKR